MVIEIVAHQPIAELVRCRCADQFALRMRRVLDDSINRSRLRRSNEEGQKGMAQKRSKGNGKRQVMWLTVYLRMAGVRPLPFRHRTQHMYVAALQRQLSLVRKDFDEEKWQQLRHDARELVRSDSLEALPQVITPWVLQLTFTCKRATNRHRKRVLRLDP